MNILAIETSCDETAAAVLNTGANFPADPANFRLLSNIVVSQIDIFKAYGGVIPEVSARSHLEAILPVVHQAIISAEKSSPTFRADNHSFSHTTPSLKAIDAIAVTHTPGLLGSLLIGTLTARTLAILHHKPLYPVHHLKSHIYSALLPAPDDKEPPALTFPVLALVVSGGHTQIIYMPDHTHFQILATTRDDAVGECFDKVAKILGLPYPGGPAITKAAASGNPTKYSFPHPRLKDPTGAPSLDFSFSGLKTAVLRAVQTELNLPLTHPSHDLKNHLTPIQISDFAASFQNTATDILLEKLALAARTHPPATIIISGGVSANPLLRQKAQTQFASLLYPPLIYSGDNAAMVAIAAAHEIAANTAPTDPYHLDILPRSPIH